MKFEIDVSGYDMFKDNYVICIANDSGEIIRGFKFNKELTNRLIANWKANKYRYEYNIYENKRGIFKVRIYSIVLYYIFKPKRDSQRYFSDSDKKEILKRQDYTCATCNDKDWRLFEFHHKQKWADNGRTNVDNGVGLCAKCHMKITRNYDK